MSTKALDSENTNRKLSYEADGTIYYIGNHPKKAKEIALDAAVRCSYASSPDQLLIEADKIYKWLIAEDNLKQEPNY